MEEQQERDIARGLREGKADAWRALYDAYAERVWHSVARLMGPGAADVADVVQETFLAAARSARTFDAGRGTLWFWLCGIARRHVALHYRKQGRLDRIRTAAAALAASHGPCQCDDGRVALPLHALQSAELSVIVRATLTELPLDYESLLTTRYLDGVPVEQIAAQECSTPVAVRSKLARARQAFREAFARYSSVFLDEEVKGSHEPSGR